MNIDPENEAAVKRDLLVYGNAVVHLTVHAGNKLKARRLNPLEVFPDLRQIVEPTE